MIGWRKTLPVLIVLSFLAVIVFCLPVAAQGNKVQLFKPKNN